jgi:6-phosphofructokinase
MESKMKPPNNCLYAHSGGISSALNATASGVIGAAQKSMAIDKILAPKHGLPGLISGEIFDVTHLTGEQLNRLYHTPSSVFGSSRFKLPTFNEHPEIYHQIHQILLKHQIGFFIYNGGGDSQDTTLKLAQFFKSINAPILCIGIPKTIDNDLPVTHYCPGYGSCAKYVATSILEATLDIRAVHPSSTKVFILEVMGRNSGWLAAASALARSHDPDAPHMILLPERAQTLNAVIKKIKQHVDHRGFCTIVVAEGFTLQNSPLSDKIKSIESCPFGHKQLGGIAHNMSKMIKNMLNLKTRFTNADYLQRAAGHIASKTDLDIAYAAGKKSINLLEQGINQVMVTISQSGLSHCPLKDVANIEKQLPDEFISACGMDVTKQFIDYATPFITGILNSNHHSGLPNYFKHNELYALHAQETTHEHD